MEATNAGRPYVRRLVIWGAPIACLLLIVGVWIMGSLVSRANAGTLDLRFGMPGHGPALVVKVDRGGPPTSPRRLIVGFNIGPNSSTN